ncbi:uncharacterized protein LOC128211352 [Mya arenaria]|uniref:uncharacterized protein LOC128211352 n=1 Tax=Mya arenaria TaxID=6604 RepID=UPI0022E5FB79|nr:uncharacterized protein LOC128211352 [Mya arenaria]
MELYVFIFGVCCLHLINGQHVMPAMTDKAPIELHHIFVTSRIPGRLEASICYTAMNPAQVVWTIDEGMVPTLLSTEAEQLETVHANGTVTSLVRIPANMPFSLIRFHIACKTHSYRVHVALDVKHGMPDTFEAVNQFSLFIPPTSEIGISPKGEARLHAMVNSTGTTFRFGIMQAEIALYSKRPNDIAHSYFHPSAAYSFLPGDETSPIRLNKIAQTATEYHADVILNSTKLYNQGAIVSVMGACTVAGPTIIKRYDQKLVMFLNPTSTAEPVTSFTLGFLDEAYDILVEKNKHGLIRCTLIGNPTPEIMLHKKTPSGGSVRITAPNYSTHMEYKTTTVFHIINASEADVGEYYCHATDGVRNVETQTHKLGIVTPEMENQAKVL